MVGRGSLHVQAVCDPLRGIIAHAQRRDGVPHGSNRQHGVGEHIFLCSALVHGDSSYHDECRVPSIRRYQVLHEKLAPNVSCEGDMGHEERLSSHPYRRVSAQRLRKSQARGELDDFDGGADGPCIRGCNRRDQLQQPQLE